MIFRVVLAPEAQAELYALESYIARESSPKVAQDYIDGIVERCGKLSEFPRRGSPRDDIGKGVRTVVFRRRITIACLVQAQTVTVLRLFYAGRNIESLAGD